MAVKLLSIEEVAARTQLAPSTIYEQIRKGQFPGSVPIGLTRRRGFVESQIEAFIEAHAARDRSASTKSDGLERYWAAVRAGLRPHPRTISRLKRQALAAAASRRPGWYARQIVGERESWLGPFDDQTDAECVAAIRRKAEANRGEQVVIFVEFIAPD
jgi:predicted DNA-binding transcriptional regulator AlpA